MTREINYQDILNKVNEHGIRALSEEEYALFNDTNDARAMMGQASVVDGYYDKPAVYDSWVERIKRSIGRER